MSGGEAFQIILALFGKDKIEFGRLLGWTTIMVRLVPFEEEQVSHEIF